MSNEKFAWPKYKDHLNKTFLEELAYKLWSTKGTRFGASQKLLKRNGWSNLSLGFLSAYLIIYGLFSVYQISGGIILDPKIIAFSSTTISILLLVFTQFESSQDFKIRANEFHKCALEISELHDEVRLFKTIGDRTDEEKNKFCESINRKYQRILQSYPNHQEIDFQVFVVKNSKYYESTWRYTTFIYCKFYFTNFFVYHLLMIAPIIVFAIFL